MATSKALFVLFAALALVLIMSSQVSAHRKLLETKTAQADGYHGRYGYGVVRVARGGDSNRGHGNGVVRGGYSDGGHGNGIVRGGYSNGGHGNCVVRGGYSNGGHGNGVVRGGYSNGGGHGNGVVRGGYSNGEHGNGVVRVVAVPYSNGEHGQDGHGGSAGKTETRN